MLLRQLLDFFPAERHGDIEALYARYTRRTRSDDVVDFVMDLHEQGMIRSDVLRDVLTLGEVTLSSPPKADPRLSPRHRLIGALGKGAMGEVFIGHDQDLQRTVAVKRIDPRHIGKASVEQRFFTEAQITAQLDHPSIVPIYNLERDDRGRLRYAMKLVRGETLEDYIAEARRAYVEGQQPDEEHSLDRRLELFLPVCNAIAYAHRRGILHRDLKPENIMVGAFGQVLVMDWGIARPIGQRERVTVGEVSEKTRAGTAVGTPSYMSPEQARGETEGLTAASDLYTLGLILHELVTLQRAVVGESSFETVVAAAAGQKRPIVHVSPKVKIPRELKGIIEQATALEIDDRYESVEAMAEDVRRFLRDEEVHAAPDSVLQRMQRWVSHHRGVALGGFFSLILVVLLVAGFIFWQGQVALSAQREAAQARERQLVALSSVVTEQAHKMDARFYSYESLLAGIGFVAELMLQEKQPPPSRQYFTDDFTTPERAPPDLAPSKVYKGDAISLDWPDFVTAPGVDRQAIKRRLDQLSAMTPTLRNVLLRSHAWDALGLSKERQRELILEDGVPFIWTYTAIEEGVLAGYPGLGIYPDDYDPRKRDWYEMCQSERGPQWGAAEADESGMGLLLTCAMGLYDAEDNFLGVAALDLTFEYIIDELLEPKGIGAAGEAYLIDKAGKVVVRESQRHLTVDYKSYKQPKFEHEELLEVFRQRSTGHATFKGPNDAPYLVLWARLEATPWVYAVIGKEDSLLAAADGGEATTK